MPPFVESSDGWSFVAGVERYSVAESRPHWPGYPVYIGAAKLLAMVFGDPILALHLLSILASAATVVPLMWIAHAWCPDPDTASRRQAAWVAGGAWALLPLPWVSGTEILSEPLALLLAMASLWWSWRALTDARPERGFLAGGVTSGAMLGARLGYMPLVMPFLYAVLRSRTRAPRIRGLWLLALSGGTAMAVSAVVGGEGWIDAAATRLAEHFGSWTRRVLYDERWVERGLSLLRTFIVHGIGGWWPGLPAHRLVPTIVLGGMMAVGSLRLTKHASRHVRWLFASAALPYAASVVLAHDPALARHAAALVALGCIAAACAIPPSRHGRVIAAGVLAVALAAGAPAALRRRDSPPLAHRLAEHVRDHLKPARAAVVVTSDVPYVRPYLERLAPDVALYSAEPWDVERVAAAAGASGREVYSTAPDVHAPERWEPVACFRRHPLSESRGPHDLWLYRRGRNHAPIVECH